MQFLYDFFRQRSRHDVPILCCPGPVQLHKSVTKSLATTQICHRDKDFEDLLIKTETNMLKIAGADSDNYRALFITGSGTSANETSLIALGKLGPLLVISNGEFGERLYKLAHLHYKNTDTLRYDWRKKINLKDVEAKLAAKKYAAVIAVHHETSTGMLNPIAKIATLAHEADALIAIDGVSSLAAEQIEVSNWGIDLLVSSSGKAVSAVPGIGIIIINNNLLNKLSTMKKTIQYLDLSTYADYHVRLSQTPNTPSVHTIAALYASSTQILRVGLHEHFATIQKRADFVRSSLTTMGYHYYDYGKNETSRVVTCVDKFHLLHANKVTKYARDKGIVLYGGKGELEDKMFQIGHIGNLSDRQVRYVQNILFKFKKENYIQVSNRNLGLRYNREGVNDVV